MNHVQLTNNAPNVIPPKDLFDSPAAWLDFPDLAFSSWISAQPVADSTRRVRISMWGKFLRYLDDVGVKLDVCRDMHVAGFIAHAALEKEQAWRYVKLIERVYVHLNMLGLCDWNPARSAGHKGVGNRLNDPMRFLDDEEKQKLIEFLRAKLCQAEMAWIQNQTEKMKKAEYAALWAGTRDVTVAAVLVGAGVKMRELVRLSVNCTSLYGTLIVPRFEFDLERTIALQPIAIEALRVWMLFRDPDLDLDRVLFPAVIDKRRDDQRTQTSKMHPATVFKRINSLLATVGIQEARASGQTLRNTFAASLIESGADDAALVEALGYKGKFSVSHLRSEHARFRSGSVPTGTKSSWPKAGGVADTRIGCALIAHPTCSCL